MCKTVIYLIALIYLALTIVIAQYNMAFNAAGLPEYVRKALRVKHGYKVRPAHDTMVMQNITLKEVFDKIKIITAAMSAKAKSNGYKVDYKFRLMKTH